MRDRQTDRQRFEDMERNIRRVRDTDRMTYRQADRQTESQTDILAGSRTQTP